jgi:hypothetical protein
MCGVADFGVVMTPKGIFAMEKGESRAIDSHDIFDREKVAFG